MPLLVLVGLVAIATRPPQPPRESSHYAKSVSITCYVNGAVNLRRWRFFVFLIYCGPLLGDSFARPRAFMLDPPPDSCSLSQLAEVPHEPIGAFYQSFKQTNGERPFGRCACGRANRLGDQWGGRIGGASQTSARGRRRSSQER